MAGYSADERAAIARGEFFTRAELAARPGLGRSITTTAPAAPAGDPNNRPPSAQARAAAASHGVCSWCYEPGDETSALTEVDHHGYTEYMHPECDTAWHDEHGPA